MFEPQHLMYKCLYIKASCKIRFLRKCICSTRKPMYQWNRATRSGIWDCGL